MMYIAMVLASKITGTFSIGDLTLPADLQLPPGCCGVLYAFDSREAAMAAYPDAEIVTVEFSLPQEAR